MAYFPVRWICTNGPLAGLDSFGAPGATRYFAHLDVEGRYGWVVYRATAAVDGAISCEYEGWVEWGSQPWGAGDAVYTAPLDERQLAQVWRHALGLDA